MSTYQTSTRTLSTQQPPEHFSPTGAVLGLILPGLGHWYLGYKSRALWIFGGVIGLFLTGLLVGGIDCVDRQEDPVWFIGQAMVGPIALGVDYAHQHYFKVIDRGHLRSARPNEYRDPATGQPKDIVTDAGGQTHVDLGGGRIISPAYPPKVRSVGKIHDVGTLFGAIAGMMNLICLIDAAFRRKLEPSMAPVRLGGIGGTGGVGLVGSPVGVGSGTAGGGGSGR